MLLAVGMRERKRKREREIERERERERERKTETVRGEKEFIAILSTPTNMHSQYYSHYNYSKMS